MPSLSAAMRPGRSLPNQISRLAVASASGSGPMGLRELDAEEVRQRRELVVLEIRVALAGDRQGVEVAARLEAGPVGQRGLEEGQVEADGVADDLGVADELERLLGGIGRAVGAFATSASVMPCIWLPMIGRPGLTKRGPAVGDLAAP